MQSLLQRQSPHAPADRVEATTQADGPSPEQLTHSQEGAAAEDDAIRLLNARLQKLGVTTKDLRGQLRDQADAVRDAKLEAQLGRSMRARLQWELERISCMLRQEPGMPLRAATRIADSVTRALDTLRAAQLGDRPRAAAVVDLVSDGDDDAVARPEHGVANGQGSIKEDL